MHIRIIALLLAPLLCRGQIQPVGQWREHLPWHSAIQVTHTAGQVWAATPYSIFSVDPDENSVTRFTKISGLTETGISAMAADQVSGKLVIAYSNSNVDVFNDGSVVNINAVKNSTITGDKTIYSIFIHNGSAYLCTGLGIVVIDLEKHQVKDTYIIGTGGEKVRVNAITHNDGFFYAATEEGVKRATAINTNLADFRNWQAVADGLTEGPVQSVAAVQNTVFALKNDSLFRLNQTNWEFLYEDGWHIKNITVSGDRLLLSETQNASGRVIVLSTSGVVSNTLQQPAYIKAPSQAIFFENEYWIADSLAGLTKFTGISYQSYIPNSPPSIAAGTMDTYNKKVYAAAGAVNSNWEPTGNKNGLYLFAENEWGFLNAFTHPPFDSLPDIVTVLADPVNESIWAGSFGGGLINIRNGNEILIYKQNSPLQPAYFDAGSYRVGGLARDAEQQIWVANYAANTELHVIKQDGAWTSFTIPFPLPDRAVSQIVIDDVNQKWIVSPKGGGLVCFNHGESVTNTADDQWKWYRAGAGDGNLPDNNVLCIAKDKSNFIWVGTARGIGIIYCPQDAFSPNGCEAVLPVVQQDNFAGYLFRDEQVQAIAVDGADRKWIGTKNGVWLISADGEKTILHFTAENSPLPDNDVRQIVIEGQSGEVFFATAKGIVSYRSDATEGSSTNSNVLVFPNPVPPGYNGTIAIRGVANNAIVKITEMDGRLIYQTRALGGQATWNGKDYKGRTISSGVYLVLVSDDSRRENLVTKIVFINK